MDDFFDISKFNEYREDNRLEVKAAEGGLPSSLWDTYSSMANTYGGAIICGVKERKDGTWFTTGMKDAAKLKKNFWNQANDQSKVSINLLQESELSTYEVEEDVILVIRVPMADREQKPVFINGNMFKGTFKRNNEGDYHCTEAEVRAMLRDQPRKTIDGKVLPKMEISELDQESIKSYRAIMESKRPGHVFLSSPHDKFLEEIGAAKIADDGRLHPTCAGLLMFGKEYKILYEYDLYFLDYREHLLPDVRWTDRIQSQSGDWSGNVFDFFNRVSAKLVWDLRKPFSWSTWSGWMKRRYMMLRERHLLIALSTLIFMNRAVWSLKYPDRIELRNSGTVIVGKKQMLRGGESEPRNGSIMKMFNLIGYGERAGSGVPDIYSVWNAAGYVAPSVEEQFGSGQPNRTIVVLPLVKNEKSLANSEKHPEKKPEKKIRKSEEMAKRLRDTLEAIKEDPAISRVALAKKLGITDSQAKTALTKLKNNRTISRRGSDTDRYWIINE